MTFDIAQGDLFDPGFGFDALAQGVNTFGMMNSGIAVTFREKWPEMFEEYRILCDKYGTHLGGLLHIWASDPTQPKFHQLTDEERSGEIPPPYPMWDIIHGYTVYNMFSQIEPGEDASYGLLMKSAILVRQDAEAQGYASIGLPWVGCGVGGLKRDNVADIFDKVFEDSEVEFVVIQKEPVE